MHQRPLLKDPFAVFSLPWFVERLNCQVVVRFVIPRLLPAVSSAQIAFDFSDLLINLLLMQDYLETVSPRICRR